MNNAQKSILKKCGITWIQEGHKPLWAMLFLPNQPTPGELNCKMNEVTVITQSKTTEHVISVAFGTYAIW